MTDLVSREDAARACQEADMPDGFEFADKCCHAAVELAREWSAAAIRAIPAVEPDYHLAALELHLQSHAAPLICDDCKRDARAIVNAALGKRNV